MNQTAEQLRSLSSDELRTAARDALVQAFGNWDEVEENLSGSHDFFDQIPDSRLLPCGFALKCFLILDERTKIENDTNRE